MDTVTPVDPLLNGANSLVIAYPVFGTIIVALVWVIVLQWRENKANRKQYDADMADERDSHAVETSRIREAHAIEMAEQRRLNLELQNARLTELKAALADVVKVTGTVEQALIALHGAHGGAR